MVDAPETHPNEPVLPGAASGDEAKVIHDIVRKVGRLPDGVQRVEFHFGEDSEGAPAVWITFVARDDLKPSKAKIAELQRVMNDVRSQVIRSGTERWPYLEIATE
jgi:hypothetical protein